MKFLLYMVIVVAAYHFFKMFTVGKKVEECKMALVGRHLFDNMQNEKLKSLILNHAIRLLQEGNAAAFGNPDKYVFEELDNKVRYVFLAHAMANIGIDHGLSNFMWTFVERPMMLQNYDVSLWNAAQQSLEQKCKIKVAVP